MNQEVEALKTILNLCLNESDTRDNLMVEIMCREHGGSFLDKNNIVWKVVNNKWIGKRSVFTVGLRACWLEELNSEGVKSWWCGKDADYSEVFTRDDAVVLVPLSK